MLKNIAEPHNAQIPMSTFQLKSASKMVTKILFDFDFVQHIITRAHTRRTFNLTQHKFWRGIARVQ